jgi:hypothetical protein
VNHDLLDITEFHRQGRRSFWRWYCHCGMTKSPYQSKGGARLGHSKHRQQMRQPQEAQ